MNEVYLLGNAGANAELRYAPSGTPVASFSLATSEKRDGQSETHWHKIVMFNQTAERMAPRVTKGAQVFIKGKLSVRHWENKEGQKQTSVEIIANWVRIIQKEDSPNPGRYGGQGTTPGPMETTMTDEDIPF